MKRTFTPYIKTIANIPGIYSSFDIKNEPQYYSYCVADINKGLTKDFINAAWEQICSLGDPKELVIDTRTSMLMKGYYPSIPGWHCDDFPRHRSDQPDLTSLDTSQHIMCILSSMPGVSCTEFITDTINLDLDELNVWGSLHKEIEKRDYLNKRKIIEGEIVYFNQEAIHRATACINPGWRIFMRISKSHRKPLNEIRTQTQIYLISENGGW